MLDLGFLPDVERLLAQDARAPADDAVLGHHARRGRRRWPAATCGTRQHPGRVARRRATVPATAQFVYQAHDLDKPEIIGPAPAGRGPRADDRLLPHQAPVRKRGRRPRRARLRRRAAARRHGQVAREQALRAFRDGKSTSSSPPTSPRAASTSRASPTSSTTPAPRTRRPTCTGSAAPAAPARPASRSRSSTGRTSPLEDDQQGARPAVRRAAGDLLHLRAPLPRPGHPRTARRACSRTARAPGRGWPPRCSRTSARPAADRGAGAAAAVCPRATVATGTAATGGGTGPTGARTGPPRSRARAAAAASRPAAPTHARRAPRRRAQRRRRHRSRGRRRRRRRLHGGARSPPP